MSTCKLPADFELDRLKENLPNEAKRKLFDVQSLSKAWDILDKYYSDTNLITQKLKNKMKNLQVKSSESHEMIIEIHEEVDYLVKRLVKLKAQELLKTDNDYLNAIYSKLPVNAQEKWDDYELEEDETEWQAFSEFLNDKYQAALRKRTRMESLKENSGTKPSKTKSEAGKGSFDIKTQDEKEIKCFKCSGIGHKSKECPTKTKSVDKEKSKVIAGTTEIEASKEDTKNKCPQCSKVHTWKPKNKTRAFPSDRFSTCPNFIKLDVKARSELLEKVEGCSYCLSWNHKKDNCNTRMGIAKCSEKVDGQACNKLHNTLLHGSTLPYCMSAKVNTSSADTTPDEHASTLMLIQDVPVGEFKARVQWDGGANKI